MKKGLLLLKGINDQVGWIVITPDGRNEKWKAPAMRFVDEFQ